jgi:hypothetical protein
VDEGEISLRGQVHEVGNFALAVITDQPAIRVVVNYPGEQRVAPVPADRRVNGGVVHALARLERLLPMDVVAREVFPAPVREGRIADTPPPDAVPVEDMP